MKNRGTLLPKTEAAAVILPMEVRWLSVRFNCIHLLRMHVMLIVRVATHTNVRDERLKTHYLIRLLPVATHTNVRDESPSTIRIMS